MAAVVFEISLYHLLLPEPHARCMLAMHAAHVCTVHIYIRALHLCFCPFRSSRKRVRCNRHHVPPGLTALVCQACCRQSPAPAKTHCRRLHCHTSYLSVCEPYCWCCSFLQGGQHAEQSVHMQKGSRAKEASSSQHSATATHSCMSSVVMMVGASRLLLQAAAAAAALQ
jgi:hypothetical protein